MTDLALPTDYPRIKLVKNFDELLSTPFGDGVNALCWPRTLPGDFAEVANRLVLGEGITTLDEATLEHLTLSDAGRRAVEMMLQDQRLLRERGLNPVLDYIRGHVPEEDSALVPRDVFSFHADSADVPADTYLCTYHGASSEGLRNDEALRRVDIPETRAALLELFGGEEDGDFRVFLTENCYDLHYAALPGAHPFSFGVGNLWRVAIVYPDCPVPPCIHRAPRTLPGDSPRLLLIG